MECWIIYARANCRPNLLIDESIYISVLSSRSGRRCHQEIRIFLVWITTVAIAITITLGTVIVDLIIGCSIHLFSSDRLNWVHCKHNLIDIFIALGS